MNPSRVCWCLLRQLFFLYFSRVLFKADGRRILKAKEEPVAVYICNTIREYLTKKAYSSRRIGQSLFRTERRPSKPQKIRADFPYKVEIKKFDVWYRTQSNRFQ